MYIKSLLQYSSYYPKFYNFVKFGILILGVNFEKAFESGVVKTEKIKLIIIQPYRNIIWIF